MASVPDTQMEAPPNPLLSTESVQPTLPQPLLGTPSLSGQDVLVGHSPIAARKYHDSGSSTTPSKTALLQQQIQALASLRSRLERIRTIPAHLIILNSQSPLISFGVLSGLGLSDGNGHADSDPIDSILNADAGGQVTSRAQEMGQQARVAFRMLNDAREELVKIAMQDALRAARDSEGMDKTDISVNGRKTRKKKRIPTADSPAPFPSFHVETTHIFPPLKPEDPKINDLDDLTSFVREYNRSRPGAADRPRMRLAIWMPSRPTPGTPRLVSDPLSMRVIICDVTTVFVKLRHPDRDRGSNELRVESIVALGPREKKSPYSHSEFMVYQKLGQHVAGMIEKEPTISLPQVVDLLTSYEDLFITSCSVCGRVLPLEGHVPPVGRVWKERSIVAEGERGCWEARHISCLHV